jgi:hypothetical protein
LYHFQLPFVCNNIPAAPEYRKYISQLIDIPELVVPVMISMIDDTIKKATVPMGS